MLVVCGHLDEADDLADDIEVFVGRRPEVLPALELAGSLGGASEELVANRLQLVDRLSRWGEEGSLTNPILVAPIQGLMQSVPSRGQMKELTRELRAGQKLEPEKLIVWLSEHGYNRLEQVEVPGDFAVRGGIVDVYLPGDHPAVSGKSENRNPKSETNSNEEMGEKGENLGQEGGARSAESEEWGEVGLPEILSVRPTKLSVTHIFGKAIAEVDVGQPRHSSPQHPVARRGVSGSVQVASKTGQQSEEPTHRLLG
jgi:hypothetical protein